MAVGDIASCEFEFDTRTGNQLRKLDGTIAILGDSVYPAAGEQHYQDCFEPTWGHLTRRIRPAAGNHDVGDDAIDVGDPDAYYRHFGPAAGTPGEGWYSYELGDWHVIVLNSNCNVMDCSTGSDQYQWLLEDLAGSDATCTLAYWHHPRFSSGLHGDHLAMAPYWQALEDADADIVLAGHDHLYERFAPQDSTGRASDDGMRSFVVGTGGAGLYAAERVAPNSKVLLDEVYGVLELTLHADSYEWRFITIDDIEADDGSGACR